MSEATSNNLNLNLPSRNITITGEYSARLVQAALRASRIEKRAIQIALGNATVRDAGRRAMDRFNQALSQLESEITAVEKELESSGRNNGARRNKGQQAPAAKPNGVKAQQPAKQAQSQQPKPQLKRQQPAQPKPQSTPAPVEAPKSAAPASVAPAPAITSSPVEAKAQIVAVPTDSAPADLQSL